MRTGLDPVAAWEALAARDYNVEGIPMFLSLERVGEAPAVAAEEALGALKLRYLQALARAPGTPTLEELARVLELLAAHHFDTRVDSHLRVINYHNTPPSRAALYERQLAAAADLYCGLSETELLARLDGEPWTKPRPGIVPVLYEGYRNSYEVALPLVERLGLRACLAVPTAFVDAPVEAQATLARRHQIGLVDEVPPDGRVAMTWDELRDAHARGHTVICHTAHHVGIADLRTDEDVRRELVESRARLEEELGAPIGGLAFLHGSPCGLDARVDAAVAEAGYRYVVSNTAIQRLP
jgi:hypothetical protein